MGLRFNTICTFKNPVLQEFNGIDIQKFSNLQHPRQSKGSGHTPVRQGDEEALLEATQERRVQVPRAVGGAQHQHLQWCVDLHTFE